MLIHIFTGFALSGVACFIAYLASPHQRVRHTQLPARPLRCLALMIWLVSLMCFCLSMHPATAVYTWLTATMVGLIAPVYLFARPQEA
ncbi:hypothetical protein KSF73_15840 [Burkholderiaceae bacterium DAT-1]|nr:hypothetical protein [Burkholderiaceae bacterium DAT-1]